MGETCLHVPARVFGFESSADVVDQPQRSPGQLERGTSLLSALLKGSRPPMPSAFMDASDAYSDDEDEEMEEREAEDPGSNEEVWEAPAAGGSAPMPIPSTSDAFLKAQREALKRFVYAHQIEEMRRQCAAYFQRQARFNEVQTAESPFDHNDSSSTAPVEAGGPALALPEATARHRKPGF